MHMHEQEELKLTSQQQLVCPKRIVKVKLKPKFEMTPTERDTIAYTLDKFQPDYQGPFQNWTDQYLKLCICIDDFMYIYRILLTMKYQ